MANWQICCLLIFSFSEVFLVAEKTLTTKDVYNTLILSSSSSSSSSNNIKRSREIKDDSIFMTNIADLEKHNDTSILEESKSEENSNQQLEQGRGKYSSYKKLSKMAYPLLMGVFVAKTFLVPLMLKLLTALSSSALIISKLALVSSIFVTLKWLMEPTAHTEGTETSRVDFIYLPPSRSSSPIHRLSSGNILMNDQLSSGSNNNNIPVGSQSKYIPVAIHKAFSSSKNQRPFAHRPLLDAGFQPIYNNDQAFL